MAAKCDACGITFATEAELREHGKRHAAGESHHEGHGHPDYSCGCGASFHSEVELKRHAAQAHGM
jgi:hypothetical protein